MFQTGSHEICGSVAARTCRAVVTTSMFMICSGSPVCAEVVPNSAVPVDSQVASPRSSRSTDDGWSEGDAHLIGAARHVEQHQQILDRGPLVLPKTRTDRRSFRSARTWPSDSLRQAPASRPVNAGSHRAPGSRVRPGCRCGRASGSSRDRPRRRERARSNRLCDAVRDVGRRRPPGSPSSAWRGRRRSAGLHVQERGLGEAAHRAGPDRTWRSRCGSFGVAAARSGVSDRRWPASA